jgi:hypothetical protein
LHHLGQLSALGEVCHDFLAPAPGGFLKLSWSLQ